MGAQEGIDVLRHVFPSSRPVLGPVREVTNHLGGGCWKEVKEEGKLSEYVIFRHILNLEVNSNKNLIAQASHKP